MFPCTTIYSCLYITICERMWTSSVHLSLSSIYFCLPLWTSPWSSSPAHWHCRIYAAYSMHSFLKSTRRTLSCCTCHLLCLHFFFTHLKMDIDMKLIFNLKKMLHVHKNRVFHRDWKTEWLEISHYHMHKWNKFWILLRISVNQTESTQLSGANHHSLLILIH